MSDQSAIEVSPDRLEWPDGDIGSSYSADRIAEDKPIRQPVAYRGQLYVATSGLHQGQHTFYCEAMRLVPSEHFDGEPTTYASKVHHNGGATARADPLGFYHGMTVKSGGRTFVMVGPKVRFVPSDELAIPTEQLGLFA